jgi:membrane associated rhomboid family serine protease
VIPISDENPVKRLPVVTLLLIVACVTVYFAVQPTGAPEFRWTGLVERVDDDDLRFVVDNAAIPCELVELRPLSEEEYRETFDGNNASACGEDGPAHSEGKIVLLGVLVTMFLHGSIAHLFGNMLFLWVFGNNIEDRRGRLRYLLLYVFGGLAATAAHVAVDPQSTVPVIGASGAIAAVMGAYLVSWPKARIKTIIFFGFVLLRKVEAATSKHRARGDVRGSVTPKQRWRNLRRERSCEPFGSHANDVRESIECSTFRHLITRAPLADRRWRHTDLCSEIRLRQAPNGQHLFEAFLLEPLDPSTAHG